MPAGWLWSIKHKGTGSRIFLTGPRFPFWPVWETYLEFPPQEGTCAKTIFFCLTWNDWAWWKNMELFFQLIVARNFSDYNDSLPDSRVLFWTSSSKQSIAWTLEDANMTSRATPPPFCSLPDPSDLSGSTSTVRADHSWCYYIILYLGVCVCVGR